MATLTVKKKTARCPAAPLGKNFFMLWKADGRRPKVRHATYEEALTERNRLKTVSPGKYFIYEAVLRHEAELEKPEE